MRIKNLLLIYFLGSVAFIATANAQTTIKYIMSLKPESIPELSTVSGLKILQARIEMPFNSAEIKDTTIFRKIRNMRILRIDLVYTTFRQSEDFKQPLLNAGRLVSLKKQAPQLFDNTGIDWHVLAQTKANTVEEASKMFHGFIITYNQISVTNTKDELSILDEALHPGIKKDIKPKASSGAVLNTRPEVIKDEKKKLPGVKGAPKIKGAPGSHGKPFVKVEGYDIYVGDTFHAAYHSIDTAYVSPGYRHSTAGTGYTGIDYTYLNKVDSTVFRALERNKNWMNMIVVEDVTGSMAPYTAQLLVWNKLTYLTRKTRHFVFFNDGDNTPDDRKVIGKTGGIYHIMATQPDQVEKTARNAMTRGSGGDCPENNIEATLHAINDCPDCQLVMIADNYANVKDIRLLAKVTKPVHIIVCGATSGINTQYLDIAKATGGTVSTMAEDYNDLVKLSEGETITIGTKQYIIRDGKFAPM